MLLVNLFIYLVCQGIPKSVNLYFVVTISFEFEISVDKSVDAQSGIIL